jgi:NTE family protein
MLKAIVKPELTKLPAWIGRKGGIGSLVVLREKLSLFLKVKTFEELQIPLIISVTNLNRGCNELISSGNLIDWVVASASIPIIFQPVVINNYYYVDGGLTNNLPIACRIQSFRGS